MVRAKIVAPPSSKSSRSTEVTTTYFRPMVLAARATRSGSSQSTLPCGRPFGTAQKPQRRVHSSPRIINVAVLCPQHSPIFGQRALSQTVCRLSPRMSPLSSW